MGRSAKPKPKKTIVKSPETDDEDIDLGIESIISRDRIIYLTGSIDENQISQTIVHLFSLSKKNRDRPIKIVINTYGGFVYEMLALYDAIKYVQSIDCEVHTIGLGKIMSAGVLLLAAGTKGNRLIGKNASVMYHMGKDDFGGNVFEIENELKEFKRVENLTNKLIAENTKLKVEEIEEIISTRDDRYFTAEEAVKMGIADKTL